MQAFQHHKQHRTMLAQRNVLRNTGRSDTSTAPNIAEAGVRIPSTVDIIANMTTSSYSIMGTSATKGTLVNSSCSLGQTSRCSQLSTFILTLRAPSLSYCDFAFCHVMKSVCVYVFQMIPFLVLLQLNPSVQGFSRFCRHLFFDLLL